MHSPPAQTLQPSSGHSRCFGDGVIRSEMVGAVPNCDPRLVPGAVTGDPKREHLGLWPSAFSHHVELILCAGSCPQVGRLAAPSVVAPVKNAWLLGGQVITSEDPGNPVRPLGVRGEMERSVPVSGDSPDPEKAITIPPQVLLEALLVGRGQYNGLRHGRTSSKGRGSGGFGVGPTPAPHQFYQPGASR